MLKGGGRLAIEESTIDLVRPHSATSQKFVWAFEDFAKTSSRRLGVSDTLELEESIFYILHLCILHFF